jgi:hypothetical protein
MKSSERQLHHFPVFVQVIFSSILPSFWVRLKDGFNTLHSDNYILIFVLSKYLIEKLSLPHSTLRNSEQFNLQKVTYRTYIGLFIPINIILFYYDTISINILLIIISIVLLINVITYLISIKKYQHLIFSKMFYFILYLCALEIAPFLCFLCLKRGHLEKL